MSEVTTQDILNLAKAYFMISDDCEVKERLYSCLDRATRNYENEINPSQAFLSTNGCRLKFESENGKWETVSCYDEYNRTRKSVYVCPVCECISERPEAKCPQCGAVLNLKEK